MNQVEIWFSKLGRDVIARGIFTSVKDLNREVMRYIRHYNMAAKPIKWSYRDAEHRIAFGTNSAVTGHWRLEGKSNISEISQACFRTGCENTIDGG